MLLYLCLLLTDQVKPLPVLFFFYFEHSGEEELRVPQTFFFFFGGGRVGEMGAQSIDQTGRKYLSFSLVSEKGIFQSATPRCCGKIILGSPGNARGKVGQLCRC